LQAVFTKPNDDEVHLGYYNNIEVNTTPQLTTTTKTSPTMKTYNKFNRTTALHRNVTSSPRKRKQSKHIGVLQLTKKPIAQSTSQNSSHQVDTNAIRQKSEYLTNNKTSQPEQTKCQQIEKVKVSIISIHERRMRWLHKKSERMKYH
jgi:hypothetical protein